MKKIAVTIFSLAVLGIGTLAYAQSSGTQYKLLAPLPYIDGVQQNSACIDTSTGIKTLTCLDFNTFVEYVFKFAIALAVFLAICVIIYGGFEYIISEASAANKSAAKSRIQNAVLGLAGALASYLILATIDPRLVQINSSIDVIKAGSESLTLFQEHLNADLVKATAQSIDQYNSLQANIDKAQQRINEIQTMMKDPNYVKDPTLEYELYTLQQQQKSDASQQIVTIGHGAGNVSFLTALDSINDTANYQTTFAGGIIQGLTLGYYSGGSTAVLSDSANFVIKTQRDIINQKYFGINPDGSSDKTGGYVGQLEEEGDIKNSALMADTGNFYLDELDNQQKLMTTVYKYFRTSGSDQAAAKTELQNSLATYSAANATSQYSDEPQIKSDAYTLYQQRVALIQKALAVTPK